MRFSSIAKKMHRHTLSSHKTISNERKTIREEEKEDDDDDDDKSISKSLLEETFISFHTTSQLIFHSNKENKKNIS